MWLPWAGLGLLALIFITNAIGVLDQRVAVRELEATGVPGQTARVMVMGGRCLQLVATPCLFFTVTRPWAAIALAMFLVGATLAAHAFWKTPAAERGGALAQFLKNAAIVGGLLMAAVWRP